MAGMPRSGGGAAAALPPEVEAAAAVSAAGCGSPDSAPPVEAAEATEVEEEGRGVSARAPARN